VMDKPPEHRARLRVTGLQQAVESLAVHQAIVIAALFTHQANRRSDIGARCRQAKAAAFRAPAILL
jgi:hypothetical protein